MPPRVPTMLVMQLKIHMLFFGCDAGEFLGDVAEFGGDAFEGGEFSFGTNCPIAPCRFTGRFIFSEEPVDGDA